MKNNIYKLLLFTLVFILLSSCGLPGLPSSVATELPTEDIGLPTVPPEISIKHQDIPVNLPVSQSGQAADFDSSKVIGTEIFIGGDRFTFNRFERPFNSNAMDVYYPEIDIMGLAVFQDDSWVYGVVELKDLQSSAAQNPKYALE